MRWKKKSSRFFNHGFKGCKVNHCQFHFMECPKFHFHSKVHKVFTKRYWYHNCWLEQLSSRNSLQLLYRIGTEIVYWWKLTDAEVRTRTILFPVKSFPRKWSHTRENFMIWKPKQLDSWFRLLQPKLRHAVQNCAWLFTIFSLLTQWSYSKFSQVCYFMYEIRLITQNTGSGLVYFLSSTNPV